MATDDLRILALRRFAIAISILTLLGHTLLGFEQSYAHVFAAIATTYGVELGLEWVDAAAAGRAPAYAGGVRRFVDFLLPAHITALACAMLLYPGPPIAPIVFAAAVGIGSKALVRVPVAGVWRHVLNPSNAGIATTLLVFPWVGIAPPYQFLENLYGGWDWVPPAVIVASGTFLNGRFTGRLPLIGAWLAGFLFQAAARSWFFGAPLVAGWVPMTGMAFVLFTFYMVSDPGTTPSTTRSQLVFGFATAALYGLLQVLHVVFGLFFSLALACIGRGVWLSLEAALQPVLKRRPARPNLPLEVAGK